VVGSDSHPHPAHFRRVILTVGLVAMATWWLLGMPYSVFAWLLDDRQLRWVFICYAWEVPVTALVAPVLFPMLWLRELTERWDRAFSGGGPPNPGDVAALERIVLDYPIRVAGVLLLASIAGYGIGALQLRIFAQLPTVEVVKVISLGLVTGLVGARFAFRSLASRLAPLLETLGGIRGLAPPAGRRIPLSQKVFAGSLILTLTAVMLLGIIAYSRAERTLEEEVGRRVLAETRALATEIATIGPTPGGDRTWWREVVQRMELGRHGAAFLVDADGRVVGGSRTLANLADQQFRRELLDEILRGGGGHAVDRVYAQRIVAYAPVGKSGLRIVSVTERADFEQELNRLLWYGGAALVMVLTLALIQGFLLSRRLTRPIEIVTDMASTIAQRPEGPWDRVPVRTNDEVGELATAFNRMTARLEAARSALERHSAELERRIAEATRGITALYELTRTTTSTLEIDDVLTRVAERILATLALPRLVLLWYPPELDDVVDGYAVEAGRHGTRFDVGATIDLPTLVPAQKATVLATLPASLPPVVAERIGRAATLCLPLVFKGQLLGAVLARCDRVLAPADLELAGALASQAAAALANASLFETARRHEAELRKLSQMRVQLQEESQRQLSRELHDGVGQILTAIKMDLGVLERDGQLDAAGLRARLREVREQVTELVAEVRTMSQILRPSMLDDFGLVPTLQFLAEKFTLRTGIPVDLRTPPAEARLPGPIEVALYRVTQEALTNVANHAHAEHVAVELTLTDDVVSLAIADDGVGFDVERFRRTPALGGVGLLGMRERVAHFHGRIEIRSRPREGVRITLAIPLGGGSTQARSA
jgi:signal transduction histidine kinase